MKIKALANYCKQTKSVVLLDQYDESGVLQRQYVQAGSAVFPLDGLPLLNEDTLIAILDIPADERCDWVVQRTNAQCALSYVQDNEENDQLSELAGITFSANGYDLQPVYTPYGLVTIKGAKHRGARTAPIRGYRRPEACYPLKAREQAANDSSTRRVIADS